MRIERVLLRGSVVGGEQDDGVVVEPEFPQPAEEDSHLPVGVTDL
nr:hypothetical protein [Streptomyces tubbatahanensis]